MSEELLRHLAEGVLHELMPGDQVEHTASGRLGVVLEVASRWHGTPAARIKFSSGQRDTRWVVRAVLRRIDKPKP